MFDKEPVVSLLSTDPQVLLVLLADRCECVFELIVLPLPSQVSHLPALVFSRTGFSFYLVFAPIFCYGRLCVEVIASTFLCCL